MQIAEDGILDYPNQITFLIFLLFIDNYIVSHEYLQHKNPGRRNAGAILLGHATGGRVRLYKEDIRTLAFTEGKNGMAIRH